MQPEAPRLRFRLTPVAWALAGLLSGAAWGQPAPDGDAPCAGTDDHGAEMIVTMAVGRRFGPSRRAFRAGIKLFYARDRTGVDEVAGVQMLCPSRNVRALCLASDAIYAIPESRNVNNRSEQ